MITTIGFEKATFGIYDEKDEKVTKKVEVNGKNKKVVRLKLIFLVLMPKLLKFSLRMVHTTFPKRFW